MARRPDVLEHTILGLLGEGPQHGYEIRKRLTAILGPFRALSYGSLYPCLHRLVERGWIEEDERGQPDGSRRKVAYRLTADGKDAFGQWLEDSGPEAWEDEGFAARMAFFSRTAAEVRLRILEGRRARLEERLGALQASIDRATDRVDLYAHQLQQHSVDGATREVGWISQLIESERGPRQARRAAKKTARRTAATSTRRPSRP